MNVLRSSTSTLSCKRWRGCLRSNADHERICSKISLQSVISAIHGESKQNLQNAKIWSENHRSDIGISILQGFKSTVVAHQFWHRIVRKGDTVVDATCGNGHDTLAMALLALGDSSGRVVAIDTQQQAVDSTLTLLQTSLPPIQLASVDLHCICHSQMEAVVEQSSASLVAFNLGYLPGGQKEVITEVDSTLAALQAATNVVAPGGIISVAAYVGHPRAREEYEAVLEYSRKLSQKDWVCSLHENINRPLSPRLVIMYKRTINGSLRTLEDFS